MTISEIAKLAGVSSAAISRYLNGGSLSEEKRKKIKEVIEETGYVPSEYARSLRTKKSCQIGVIVPNISSNTVARIVSGISAVLYEKGYRLLLANTDNDPRQELDYLEMFGTSQIDGVIYIASLVSKRHIELLKALKVPVVIVGQLVAEYDCVYHDDFHAARDMMNVLLEAGSRRPGCLFVTEKDRAVGAERIRGVEAALIGYGRDPKMIPRVESGFTIESGYEKMGELLKLAPDLDGVFCATASLAVGAVMYLKDIGKQIPEEIKVCALGSNQTTEIVTPRLTTAKFYYRTSGMEAAQMLLSMVDGKRQHIRHMMLGYEIVRRGTTDNGKHQEGERRRLFE